MNWKEILISSAEVAFLAAITEFSALQQISWATLVPVGLTFLIKLLIEIKNMSSLSTAAGRKKKFGVNTLFFKTN